MTTVPITTHCGSRGSQGETKQEAIENIKDAIKLCLEVRAERGMPQTLESQQIEVTV